MPNHNKYHNGHIPPGRNGDQSGFSFDRARVEAPEEDEIDLKKLFFVIWRRKWLVAGIIVLFGLIAGIYAFTRTPIYQSQGDILIYQSQNSLSGLNLGGGGGALSSLISGNYGLNLSTNLKNEMEVLQSRKLSLNIADSLLKERIMPNGRQYPVIFKRYPDDSTVTSRDTVAARLRSKLTFQQAESGANVINVIYESPSAVAAGRVVNVALNQFDKLSNKQKRNSANSAATFLKHEKARVKDSLNVSENRLRQFMNRHKLVQVDAQTRQLVQQMANLEAARQEAKAKLEAANSGIEQYKSQLNSIKPGLAEQYSDAVGGDISKLQYAKSELEVKKQKLLANNPQLTESSASVEKLNRKIASYKKRIKKITQNLLSKNDQYLGFLSGNEAVAQNVSYINQQLIKLKVQQKQYQAQVDVISAQLQKENKFFNNLPDNIVALAKRKRDVEVNEALYETLVKQYAQTSIQERSQFGLGRVIDRGYTPKKPVEPNKPLYLLIGLFTGGVLSVGYIFFRFAFVDTIESAENMEEMPVPLLAVIPELPSDVKQDKNGAYFSEAGQDPVSDSLVAYKNPNTACSDAFRRLQYRLIYTGQRSTARLIAITSSIEGEGKTTVSANLAACLAGAGQKTLLLDADFRRPGLHDLFGVENKNGLTDVITENVALQDSLQQTATPGLWLLPAGKQPSNTASIIRNQDFAILMEKLDEQFDYVIIDTAPVGTVADSTPVLQTADGTIVLARFGQTDKAEVQDTIHNLQQLNITVLGTVLTAYDYDKSHDVHKATQYYSYR